MLPPKYILSEEGKRPPKASSADETESDYDGLRQCVQMVVAREIEEFPATYRAVRFNDLPTQRVKYILDPLGNVVNRRCRRFPQHGDSYCHVHQTGNSAAALAQRKTLARDKALETLIAALDSPDHGLRVRGAKVVLDYLGKEAEDTTVAVREMFARFEKMMEKPPEPETPDPE